VLVDAGGAGVQGGGRVDVNATSHGFEANGHETNGREVIEQKTNGQETSGHPGEIILETRGLTRVFGSGQSRVVAVDHVDFQIKAGEIVALIGESGSGKTTMGRMLLGLLPPTEGQVLFRGQDLETYRKRRDMKSYWRSVQAVFQDPFASFNGFYRVGRTLMNAFKLLPQKPPESEREEKIFRAVDAVGLNPVEVLSKFPHELSGGQRQRLMIARALLVEPDVLIADEPTSMVDASSRAGVLNILLELRERLKLTIIFITHDIGMAYYTSDRLLIMQRGRIVEEGPAEEIIRNPRHQYTRNLLADVPTLHREWELSS